tara:strand:- start:11120 stop:12514 length:1395 start_codon:yes stop_codon:yes gene_type:complete
MNFRSNLLFYLALWCVAATAPCQSYSIANLGVPGGRPQAINENGFVVGWYTVAGGVRPFVHDPVTGTYTDIGVLAGMSFGSARDINSLGQIVGSSWPTAISQPGRAYLFTPGVGLTDLGVLSGPTSEAYCVDDLGNVGGRADGTAFTPEAFLQLAGGAMQSVQPGTSGTVHDLTSTGWRAGVLGNNQAFYWPPGGAVTLVPLPAATPLGRATGITDSGWVVGEMSDPSGSPSFAFRYHVPTGVLDNLGSISRFGTVAGVDSVGTVIANRRISISSSTTPLISIAGAQLVEIDTLLPAGTLWSMKSVAGINEFGQICGLGDFGGAAVPVRLDPPPAGPFLASANQVGGGCSAAVLGASPPRIGRPWRLAMRNAGSNQPVFSLLTTGHHAPIALLGSSCGIYMSPLQPIVAELASSNAIGSWASHFDMPANPSIAGVLVTHQMLLWAPALPFGLAATEATRATIGN